VANGIVYEFEGGFAAAFNATTGVTVWSEDVLNCCVGPGPSAVVANGVVYVGPYTFNLFGLQATTGLGVWFGATSGESTGIIGSSPAVANGKAYAVSDHSLDAFDVTTNCGPTTACAPLWTSAIGGPSYDISAGSSPTVANGVVYVGSADDNLYAFDAAGTKGCSGTPKTCAPLWTATTGGEVESSPAVANGMVYVGSGDHKLHAYGLP
jgi:outer membrane protein assembly factor BamB